MIGTEINKPHAAPAERRQLLLDPGYQLDKGFGFAPPQEADAVTHYL